MDALSYVILGIIQGITEPLPISSSGHLIIFQKLFNFEALRDLNFEIIVNFGSLLAILIIYQKELKELFSSFFRYLKNKDKKDYNDYRYVLLVALGTIPAGIIGFISKDKIESMLTTTAIVGISLIFTSVFLFSISKMKGRKKDKEISYIDALKIGFFQVLALIPGVSRSAATLTGAMLSDLDRKTAVKFSFMLYIPISIASFILGVTDISNLADLWYCYILGMFAATVATYYATNWFIDLVKKGKLVYFAIYCLIIGIVTILFI